MSKIDWMTPSDIKASYIRGMQNCQATFNHGVDNPRQNPLLSAIQAIQAGAWKAGVNAGFPTWKSKLGSLSLSDWIAACAAAASLYETRAKDVGSVNWEKFYSDIQPALASAVSNYLKSDKGEAATIQMWTDIKNWRSFTGSGDTNMLMPVSDAVAKYVANVNRTNYQKGTAAVKESPGKLAVAKADKYLKNTLAAESKLIEALTNADLSDWVDGMKNGFDKMVQKAIAAANSGKINFDKIWKAATDGRKAARAISGDTLQDSWKRHEANKKAIQNAWK